MFCGREVDAGETHSELLIGQLLEVDVINIFQTISEDVK